MIRVHEDYEVVLVRKVAVAEERSKRGRSFEVKNELVGAVHVEFAGLRLEAGEEVDCLDDFASSPEREESAQANDHPVSEMKGGVRVETVFSRGHELLLAVARGVSGGERERRVERDELGVCVGEAEAVHECEDLCLLVDKEFTLFLVVLEVHADEVGDGAGRGSLEPASGELGFEPGEEVGDVGRDDQVVDPRRDVEVLAFWRMHEEEAGIDVGLLDR